MGAMTRRVRLVAALLALCSLLFTQWAVASYACDEIGMAMAASQAAASDDGTMSMDDALCAEHCKPAKVTVDAAVPLAAVAVALAAPLRVASLDALEAHRTALAAQQPQPAPSPPLATLPVLRV